MENKNKKWDKYDEFRKNNQRKTIGNLRDEIKELLERYDGTTVDSVSKKTDVVIVGDSPGSKYDKAVKLGIEIWNEDKLKEVIDSL